MKRWLFVAVACLVFAPAVQAQDAQKLFEAMEQKLSKAKVHKFGFDIEAMENGSFKIKGTMILAAGNKVLLAYEGEDNKRKLSGKIVSDGKTMVMHNSDDPKPETKPASDMLFDVFSAWLIRVGVFIGVESGLDRSNPKDAKKLKLSGFKMVGKEKVGDREANVIEFQMQSPDDKDKTATCKLWLDAQSNIPLKRIIEAMRDGKVGFRAVETYTQWELDPKLADNTFDLPK